MLQQSEAALAKLISHEKEPVKQYIEFDGESRPSKIFTAHFKAKDGDKCLVTFFEYLAPGSTQVQHRNEFIGTWVSATMNSSSPEVPDELKK